MREGARERGSVGGGRYGRGGREGSNDNKADWWKPWWLIESEEHKTNESMLRMMM